MPTTDEKHKVLGPWLVRRISLQSRHRCASERIGFIHPASLLARADEVIEQAGCPLLAQSDVSLRLIVLVAIGGIADMNGRVASAKSVETDPQRTCGNV
jgi:hypothetical protein